MRNAAQSGRRPRPEALLIGLCLLTTGCSALSRRTITGAEAGRGTGWERVEDVVEVRQTAPDGCGAAALAMVLGHWGRSVSQEDIRAANPPTSGDGLRAEVLRDFARAQGLEAFLIEGRHDDLQREVRRDRPVLVGVVKRDGPRTWRHYEVVVGLDRERQRILTVDPAAGRSERSVADFTAEWAEAGRLALVVFPPKPAAPVADGAR